MHDWINGRWNEVFKLTTVSGEGCGFKEVTRETSQRKTQSLCGNIIAHSTTAEADIIILVFTIFVHTVVNLFHNEQAFRFCGIVSSTLKSTPKKNGLQGHLLILSCTVHMRTKPAPRQRLFKHKLKHQQSSVQKDNIMKTTSTSQHAQESFSWAPGWDVVSVNTTPSRSHLLEMCRSCSCEQVLISLDQQATRAEEHWRNRAGLVTLYIN